MPRFGRLYAAAVLRPLAEQLVDALHVRPGDTVCDVVSDSGELARTLVARVGADGHVLAADTDAAIVVHAHTCDAAACLFTGAFAPAVVQQIPRLLRPGGRALLACWDPDDPPPHEAALADALHEAGVRSAFLEAVVQPPVDVSAGSVVHDVVRFDGFAAYWAALVRERPLNEELATQAPDLVARVQEGCRRRLQRYEAADETLRIPVSARFVDL